MEKTKKKILIVDDKYDVRMAFKKVLEVEGFDVMTAGSGKECLALIKRKNVDLILLDFLMPGMSGVTVLKKIKKSSPCQKIVMVTVINTKEEVGGAMKEGVDGYVVKPVSKQELIQVVKEVLSEGKKKRV